MFTKKCIFPVLLTGVSLFFLAGDVFAVTANVTSKNEAVAKTDSTVKEDKTVKTDEIATVDKKEPVAEPMQQVSNSVPHLGVNWDLYGGYAFSNWSSFTNGGNGAWAYIGGISPRSHAKGGFNIGGDLGYQIIRYLGMEFGYYYFKQVDGDNLSVQTPYFYAAAKVGYPFLANDDLSIFAKFGMAYRVIEYGGGARQGVYNNKRYSFNFLYGLGVQYYFTRKWKASAQWLEIPKNTNGGPNTTKSSRQVPRTDQLLLGLGYLFSI
jgi:hypothetical protein